MVNFKCLVDAVAKKIELRIHDKEVQKVLCLLLVTQLYMFRDTMTLTTDSGYIKFNTRVRIWQCCIRDVLSVNSIRQFHGDPQDYDQNTFICLWENENFYWCNHDFEPMIQSNKKARQILVKFALSDVYLMAFKKHSRF